MYKVYIVYWNGVATAGEIHHLDQTWTEADAEAARWREWEKN